MDFEKGKELWKAMESLVDSCKAYSLGISDIEIQEFIELHHFAKVKPEVIQINLESCCVVPPELVTFTRENSIQLLTHNDPQNILPNETKVGENNQQNVIYLRFFLLYQVLIETYTCVPSR